MGGRRAGGQEGGARRVREGRYLDSCQGSFSVERNRWW